MAIEQSENETEKELAMIDDMVKERQEEIANLQRGRELLVTQADARAIILYKTVNRLSDTGRWTPEHYWLREPEDVRGWWRKALADLDQYDRNQAEFDSMLPAVIHYDPGTGQTALFPIETFAQDVAKGVENMRRTAQENGHVVGQQLAAAFCQNAPEPEEGSKA